MHAMPGYPGEKIGEGAHAEVHAWGPGQVVKLFRPGVRRRIALHESRMTRAVFAAGIPAPEVFDEVTVEGRHGIVLERLDGPTLMQLSRTSAMTHEQVGTILATLAISVHKTPPPPDMLRLCDDLDARLRLSDAGLPEHIIRGVGSLMARLEPADGLCHGDLHSGNVIMTAEGAKVIDWTGATRAPAAFDLATSQVVLSEIAPGIVPDPDRPRAINAAFQAAYARLSGISPEALAASIEAYLPVARILALLTGAAPGQRDALIQHLEASLGSREA